MLGRRTLLKAVAALPLAQLVDVSPLSAQRARAPVRFIVDARLPDAPRLIEQARRGGHAIADPEGEIIRLMLRPGDPLSTYAGSVLGLTGYSDFVLARDALRMAGRPMRFAARIDGQERAILLDRDGIDRPGGAAAAIDALLATPVAASPARSTSFIWLA